MKKTIGDLLELLGLGIIVPVLLIGLPFIMLGYTVKLLMLEDE